MTLEEALAPIAPVVGLSSLIGAPESVSSRQAEGPSLDAARTRLAALKKAMDHATSDYSYWGYAGQHSYWTAVVDILEAAELVGNDRLPDVPAPETGGVVMDSMAQIESYGRAILDAAKAMGTRDGFDLTVVLDCGDWFRQRDVPGLPNPKIGDYYACSTHSEVHSFDHATGDANYERDIRVVEVRRES